MKKILLAAVTIMLGSGRISGQCSTTYNPSNDCATYGDQIDTYVLDGTSASGNGGCSNNGYGFFPTPVWNLQVGSTYSFATTVGSGAWDQGFAIWIDFDNDGAYAPSEMVWTASTPGTSHSGTFSVPFNASVGSNRTMRIRCTYDNPIAGTDACVDYLNGNGETEDYLVNITCPSAINMTVASTNTYICLGQSTTFTASGAQNYAWTSGPNSSVASFTPNSTTSYTLTGTIGVCPSASTSIVKTVSVTSVPLPLVVSSSTTTICAGSPATLTGIGANNFTWMPNSLPGSSIAVNPSSTTIYTLIGYNGSGCPGASTLQLNVNPIPTVNVASTATSICPGESVTLTATGGINYTWQGSTHTGSTIVVSPTVSSAFDVTGDNSSGCTSPAQVVIVVKSAPTLITTSSQTLVCVNSPVTLNASGAQTYTWVNGPVSNSNVVQPVANTVYTVMGSATTSVCVAFATVAVNVLDPAVVISPSVTAVCPGGMATLTASGADTYLWSNGFPQAEVTFAPTAPITVTVTGAQTIDGVTCSADRTAQINVHALPTVSLTAERTTMCTRESNTLTATGGLTYIWSNNVTNTTSSQTFSTVAAVPVNVTVTGTDANGCKNTSFISVKVNACTGIEETGADSGFQVYPNPSDGAFTVRSSGNMLWMLTDNMGRRIADFSSSAEGTGLHYELPAGIYFIVSMDNAHPVHHKIVIAK